MSNRERWIVYPMLFFAIMLGIADLMQRSGMLQQFWRDAQPPRFQEIRCRQLVLEGIDHQPLAVLNQNDFGEVQLSMLSGEAPSVVLKTGKGGGQLILLRDGAERAIFLGHDNDSELSGLTGMGAGPGGTLTTEPDSERVEVYPWEK